jgi:hypothetical protein
MDDRFTKLPRYLEERTRIVRLAGDIPALVAHPDPEFSEPAPLVLWLHGRTAYKELDAGRYLRWVRAGIGACAIDLPGHGERAIEGWHDPKRTLDVLEQALGEIDAVVDELAPPHEPHEPPHDPGTPTAQSSGRWRAGAFDRQRLAIGGMSAGGMVALRRLCDPHPFRCAEVEGTSGALRELYLSEDGEEGGGGRRGAWPVRHDPARVEKLDPLARIEGFEPIPLLALHSESDELVPWPTQRTFLERLAEHYRERGADPASIGVLTWPETGAPREHLGFGRFSNEAKNAQTEFFERWLGGEERTENREERSGG